MVFVKLKFFLILITFSLHLTNRKSFFRVDLLSPLRQVYFCQNQGGYQFHNRSLLVVNEDFKICIQRRVWQKDACRSGLNIRNFTF